MKFIENILLLSCLLLSAPLFSGCEKDDDEQRVELIETTRIKAITYDSARCVSYVKGNCSEKGIIYSSEQTPDVGIRLAASGSSNAQFETPLVNLEKGQTYLIRTYAVCNGEMLYSPQKSFTTLRDGEPLMQIAVPSEVTTSSAILEGYVVANGGSNIIERGFCYGPASEPTLENGEFAAVKGDIGHLTHLVTELEDGTTYYSRVYVRNETGVFYSDAEPFTTMPFNKPLPTLITISGLGTATMTVNASVSSDNPLDITGRGIRYSVDRFEDGVDVAAEAAGLGEYTVVVNGLRPGQLYNVWAYAENRKGRAYSEVMTAEALVRIEKVGAVSRSAEGSFSIANLGAFEAPVTQAGLCWSTSPAPTIEDDHAEYKSDNPLDIGTYEGVVFHGLKPSTTYYIRAYAISEYGESYSEEQTFTTRQDLYDAHLRVGSEGGKLPYMNAWQIIINKTKSSSDNVPESQLSPAFRTIYMNMDVVCETYNKSDMNGIIYRLRPTTEGGMIMQYCMYYMPKGGAATLTGWINIQFERNSDDGTFLFLQHGSMANWAIYKNSTPENKAHMDLLLTYFEQHRFYFEWASPDYEFGKSGATVDTKNGPIRLVPVDAPDDYWTFTNKHYTASGDISPVADPFK